MQYTIKCIHFNTQLWSSHRLQDKSLGILWIRSYEAPLNYTIRLERGYAALNPKWSVLKNYINITDWQGGLRLTPTEHRHFWMKNPKNCRARREFSTFSKFAFWIENFGKPAFHSKSRPKKQLCAQQPKNNWVHEVHWRLSGRIHFQFENGNSFIGKYIKWDRMLKGNTSLLLQRYWTDFRVTDFASYSFTRNNYLYHIHCDPRSRNRMKNFLYIEH